MSITYFPELIQGSDSWLQARCGLLTASEMKLILTPTLKQARNEKERTHLYELLGQRVTGNVEPHFIGDDMIRGMEDEVTARILYAERYAPVKEMGFITNDKWGFKLGYSPDGLVGSDGAIECKSRRQKYQVQTIVENLGSDGGETIPSDYLLQIQTGLLVAELKWIDFISYCGGLPMVTIRVHPISTVQEAILDAASDFEKRLAEARKTFIIGLNPPSRTIPTERRQEMEITL